ncbi:MAG: hypothetical protein AB2L18_06715 [Anaerolineaceae bacterium]
MKRMSIQQNLMLFLLAITITAISGCKFIENDNQITAQTAQVTQFAPTEQPAVVELRSASANSDKLTFVVSILGLELVKDYTDLENVICQPYLRTDEHVQFSSYYQESSIPSEPGDPILITYEYGMQEADLEKLHVHVDLTIGPCGPDLQEMLVTPSPKIDLIANYSFSFVVVIEK